VKPLYYFHDSRGFAFSSEKRSLIKSGLINPEIDLQSLFTYLTFQSTGYPNSIIKEIHQIDPGTYLKVSKNAVEVKTYWDITHFHQNEIEDSKQVRKHVFNLLLDAVQKRRSSDVELGVFLSGGIDSSAIVGLMSLGSNQRINTFNLANTRKEYDESGYAESIAKRFSTSHSKIFLNTDEILSKVTDGLNAMDSPTADGINTYLISSAIRRTGLKVALSGIGGDELFVGYPGFTQYYNANKLRNAFRLSYILRKPLAFLMSSFGSGKTARLGRMFSFKNPSIDLVYPILREILPPKRIRNFIVNETDPSTLGEFLSSKSAELKSFELYSQYSIAEYLGYSQKTLLKDTDQMSMAVGLEIREPFFDYKMIEYVLALPDHFKIPTSPKKLLVDAVYPILPKEIANRSKQGFLLPWKSWMQNELFTLCDFHIRSFSERDYVHTKPLLEYWHRFLKNDPSIRWMELWQIVVLDYWLQKNLD
jgi:asparagine synthase (glutamine-hydrolysing)